jgi:adenosylcobinamide kinase / adenosylcobinamide-phosphate guanylyltransferase
MKTLILGGARSGKSRYAESLAASSGLQVIYIATAQVADAEFAARVAIHRQRRPQAWQLIEEPFNLAAMLRKHAAPERFLLVDCLTLYLAQWLCDDCLPPVERSWEQERNDLFSALPDLPGQLALVSNEVGMGIVPLGEINRRFQDESGRLNQTLAAICDSAVLMAAGLPLLLK